MKFVDRHPMVVIVLGIVLMWAVVTAGALWAGSREIETQTKITPNGCIEVKRVKNPGHNSPWPVRILDERTICP